MDDGEIDCGNERTIHMLYLKLARPALGKTMNLVNSSAAEEILQEVFTKLWHNKMKFPNIKSAYAFVYKCCTNAAIDYMRNRNHSHSVLDDEIKSSSISPDDLEQKMLIRDLWAKTVKLLTADEAALFIYRQIEGLSQDEVAEVMHISRRSVNRLQEKLDFKLEKIRSINHVG